MKRPFYAPMVAGVVRLELGLYTTGKEASKAAFAALNRDFMNYEAAIACGHCRVFIAIER